MINGKFSEGYLGATRWDGVRSHEFLYGADLSKAVRQELKQRGIKGVTVRCSAFSGGQELTVTIKTSESDFIPFDEYKGRKTALDFFSEGHVWVGSRFVTLDHYNDMTPEERTALRDELASETYKHEKLGDCLQYSYERCDSFTDELKSRIRKVKTVIDAFRYDDTNSQVDYFDTNFYYDIRVK